MTRMDAPHLTLGIHPDPDDHRTIADLHDLLLTRGARPDGDGFFIERGRRMLVQPVPASDDRDPRPVEILLSAGPLGDPGYPRREMATFARWVTDLLVAMTDRTRPLYGAVGVEQVFPRIDDMRSGIHVQGYATDPLFVRRDLLAQADLEAVLAREYRHRIEGSAGTVFTSGWPFAGAPTDQPDRHSTSEPWAGGRALGRAAARHIRERASHPDGVSS